MLGHSAITAAPRQCDENVAEHRHPTPPEARNPSSSSRTTKIPQLRIILHCQHGQGPPHHLQQPTHQVHRQQPAARQWPRPSARPRSRKEPPFPAPSTTRRPPLHTPVTQRDLTAATRKPPPHTRTSAASSMAWPRRHLHGRAAPPPPWPNRTAANHSCVSASRSASPSSTTSARSGHAPPRHCAPHRAPPHRNDPPAPPTDPSPPCEGGSSGRARHARRL